MSNVNKMPKTTINLHDISKKNSKIPFTNHGCKSNKIDDKLKSLELSTIQSEEDPNDSLICSNISVPSTATKLIEKSSLDKSNPAESSSLILDTFSQSSASKLIRRKIPRAGHLMTPRHLWIQSIPPKACDVVLTFTKTTDYKTIEWVKSLIVDESNGFSLSVNVQYHSSTDSYCFYLTASFHVLMKAAQDVHLPKKIIGCGGLREFILSEMNIFEGIEDHSNFFTMQERQTLILYILNTLRVQNCDWITELVESQPLISECMSNGIIEHLFPVHENKTLKWLRIIWVKSFFSLQPLDKVCDYFGVKIAMYFAWIGHYTGSLIYPAIAYSTFWFGFGRQLDQWTEGVWFVVLAFMNVIWLTVYLETWKRYCAELAYRWATLDQRHQFLLQPRLEFKGHPRISPITGKAELWYPNWKRRLFSYFVSAPIIGLCLAVVFALTILQIKFQDWWDLYIETNEYPTYLSYISKIMLALIIAVLDDIYNIIAVWLNDCENYRLDTEYENQLIIKVTLFQFVNSFLSLFYIAFYLQDQERLRTQLAVLLITRQLIRNIKESALPYVLEQIRFAKISFDLFGALTPSDGPAKPNGERVVSQPELECSMFKFDGTFSEHLEIFIQFGYVVMFSSAFPLAALCAFLNNLIEIRSDAFKMCYVYQRPFGQRIKDIGMWQNIMEVMGFIAVLVNCALIGLSGQVHRLLPDMTAIQTVLLIVALEHIMLAFRCALSCLIPDVPQWIATEMAKTEYIRREAASSKSQ
ncbi:unnamed protein product [Aphis gossypii]|uniref:Anoctamin n=1 Tax=Aphis gossypii TaxID=80765 RepID=A0A9P0NDR1_APHGO|nr:unnamed protein product [Aphis gossypii]